MLRIACGCPAQLNLKHKVFEHVCLGTCAACALPAQLCACYCGCRARDPHTSFTTAAARLQVHPGFSTNSERVACYNGSPLMTPAGPCTVQSVVGATIK